MKHFVGLDVSLKETSICIVDQDGHIVSEGKVLSEPEAIAAWLAKLDLPIAKVGREIGGLARWLHGELRAAGLPAVATEVGQCGEVLAGGAAGLLVPPAAPEALAAALLRLLGSSEERARFGKRLRERVATHYGADTIVEQIAQVYQRVLTRNYSALPRVEATECAS